MPISTETDTHEAVWVAAEWNPPVHPLRLSEISGRTAIAGAENRHYRAAVCTEKYLWLDFFPFYFCIFHRNKGHRVDSRVKARTLNEFKLTAVN